MAQPVSQSKKYRDLTLNDIHNLTEEEAKDCLAIARWGSTTRMPCPNPDCKIVDEHYVRRTRKQWRCKHCYRDFSVTSGTPLADRKLSYKKLIAIVYEFISDPFGAAANRNCSRHGIPIRTFYQNTSKLRECLLETQDRELLKGIVQIDGGYFCGKPRRANKRQKATSVLVNNKLRNRKAAIIPDTSITHSEPWNEEKLKNRRIVIAIRQLVEPLNKGHGADKTITIVLKSLNNMEMLAIVKRFVHPSAIVWTDSGREFSRLSLWVSHEAVNHTKEYMRDDGVNNNQAESFMARLRRSEYGTYNGMRPQYFAQYAAETAWREDVRKVSLRVKFEDILKRLLNSGLSKFWRGYCQGRRVTTETIGC